MGIREEFEKEGNWLFRYRSHLPLLAIPLVLAALRHSEFLERVGHKHLQTYWEVFCVAVSYLGFVVRCLTLGSVPEGTSGRNTKGQLAEVMNTTGMYSVVRHPLYLGNFLITFGIILFFQVWWFAVMGVLIFWLYYERIMFAEEEFLRKKFGEDFVKWSEKTPAFIPDFAKWKKPRLPFSWKMVLKREYSGFLGIIVAFVSIKFCADFLAENELVFRKSSIAFLAFGFIVYFTLLFLRKKTKLLHIEKRS